MKYILTAFILGIIFCFLVLNLLSSSMEFPLTLFPGNVSGPGDDIKENQIQVYNDKIIIEIENASIGRYAATGSMTPVLNENSNGIRVPVYSEKDIQVGDIITFSDGNELIVHRVIEKGEDLEGVYFITKGDNNSYADGKIRFEQIKYKTIGVLW